MRVTLTSGPWTVRLLDLLHFVVLDEPVEGEAPC